MEKKFYTFEEILLTLRTEYLKHQKLLVELKKYLSIEDDNIKNFYFNSNYKVMDNDKIVYDKQLLLIIEERLKLLNKFKAKLSSLVYGYCGMDNKLFYNVNSDASNQFGLNLEQKGIFVDINPIINITNQKEFDELVNEILNTDFMNLIEPQIKQLMIDGWSLSIYNDFMRLGNYCKSIVYNPEYDIVRFRGIDYQGAAISLIKSPIPEYHINDTIKKLIDKNFQVGKTIIIDEYNFNKKETTLQVEESSNGLKLVKRKQITKNN